MFPWISSFLTSKYSFSWETSFDYTSEIHTLMWYLQLYKYHAHRIDRFGLLTRARIYNHLSFKRNVEVIMKFINHFYLRLWYYLNCPIWWLCSKTVDKKKFQLKSHDYPLFRYFIYLMKFFFSFFFYKTKIFPNLCWPQNKMNMIQHA